MEEKKNDNSLENIDLITFNTNIRSRLHKKEIVN